MVFSNLIFLFLFLPACLALYFAAPGITAKNVVLVVFSLLFYAWGEPVYVLLLVASAGFNFGMGCLLGRLAEKPRGRKWALIGTIAVDLAALGVFKYAGLLVETFDQLTGLSLAVPQIALPIGISFYTFQAMSYVVDVYRGQVKVQRSYLNFLVYISLFPQLIAGPIVRYADIENQLADRHTTAEDAFRGLLRFATGLGKKILIADYAFDVATRMLDGQLGSATVLGTWLGVVMYGFQLYFDFSGYSDMAIGLGRMFGFHYNENFDLPYMSRSITEFWRRWHISLGSFFRDYVYIPLGGNRRHRWLNLLITWSLTGLWHGASWNFLLWGLYFFALLEGEKLLAPVQKKLPKVLRHFLTMFLVVIGWTIFYFTDFGRLGQAFAAMFGQAGACLNTDVKILVLNSLPLLFLCLLGSSPLPRLVGDLFGMLCAGREPGGRKQKVYVVVCYLYCAAVLALSVVSLVGRGYSTFLYFRF